MMDKTRSSRPAPGRWPLLLIGLAFGVGPGASAAVAQVRPTEGAPTAKLSEAERTRRLQERDRHRNEAVRLANSDRMEDAVREAEAALAIERETLGELSKGVAESLGFLARLHEIRRDWAAARKALQARLALRERQPDRKDWRVGDARRDLADLDRRAAMTPEQRRRLEWARQVRTETDGLMAKGQYKTAEAASRNATQILKDLLGEDHADYASSLDLVGLLYQTTGDYRRAEPLLRRALEIRKKALGEDHPGYATSLDLVGLLYRDMGDYARAEPLLHRAMEIVTKAMGKDHPNNAVFLNNLAMLYSAQADYARAAPHIRRALEIREKAVGQDNPEYAAGLNNLGSLYRKQGDYRRAEPLLRRALEIRKKVLGEDHPDYAASLVHLGLLYRTQGDYARAEPLLRQAVEIQMKLNRQWGAGKLRVQRRRARGGKKALGEDDPHYALLLSEMGSLYQDMGDPRRAEPWLREALEIQTALINDNAPALGARPRVELLGSLRRYLDRYLSILQQTGAGPEGFYARVLDWKGAGGDRVDHRLVRDRPALRPVLEELTSVRARLAHLAFAPAPAQREAWRRQLDALRERKEDLEAELGRQGAGDRSGKPAARVGTEEVAAALPAGTALIDLIVYAHYSPPPGGKGKPEAKRRLLAFVVRRDRPVVCIALGDEEPVGDAVIAWRRALLAHRSEALRQSAAALGRLVWEPLRPHLADARTVQVAPDGPLMRFPFACLPGRQPGSYLIEDIAIGYVGSGREAAALRTATGGTASGGLLAAGAIDFQADPGRAAPQSPANSPLFLARVERGGFGPLPGTRAEGELARDLFHRAFPDQSAVLLTGGEPTEAEIKKRLDGGHWRAVHLGTHGFFESPARVAALRDATQREPTVAPASELGAADDDAAVFALAPFLNSGIVLAGGGRATDSAQWDPLSDSRPAEDGILTAEEVQSLDLRGTELVVLSACETGLGQGRYGQGVLGLQRAFHAAGARAVVASLWKVDDAATSVLMERFYTNVWVQKMSRLEALRQAQLAVLNDPALVRARRAELAKRGIGETPEKLPEGGRVAASNPAGARSDPSLWAAFVLSGDGR